MLRWQSARGRPRARSTETRSRTRSELVVTSCAAINTWASPWRDPSAAARKRLHGELSAGCGVQGADDGRDPRGVAALCRVSSSGKFCNPFAPASGSSVSLAVTPSEFCLPPERLMPKSVVGNDLVGGDPGPGRCAQYAYSVRTVVNDDVAWPHGLRSRTRSGLPVAIVAADHIAPDHIGRVAVRDSRPVMSTPILAVAWKLRSLRRWRRAANGVGEGVERFARRRPRFPRGFTSVLCACRCSCRGRRCRMTRRNRSARHGRRCPR